MSLVIMLSIGVRLGIVEGKDTCLCTDTESAIYTAPISSSPVFGILRPGECLHTTIFERQQHWHKVRFEGLENDFFYVSGDFHLKECSGHMKKQSTCEYCHRCCPHSMHRKRQTHHHMITAQWSDWSHCSVTCGTGIQYRHCTHNCHGIHPSTQSQHCNEIACPAHYSAWSQCSATCGNGTRTRQCIHNCPTDASSTQTTKCYLRSCPAQWSTWSHCSVTCGNGIITKHCLKNCAGLPHTTLTHTCHQSNCPVELEGSTHVCDKLSTIQALVELNITEITHCPDRWSSGTEHFLTSHCPGIPNNTTQWIKGISVRIDCRGAKSIALYTPIGTYLGKEYQQWQHEGYSGIFISCTPRGFKMAVQACEGAAEVIDIPHFLNSNSTVTNDAKFQNNANVYYTIRW